jgi:hypothetical protein
MFNYDLKLLSFKKMKHKIYKESIFFKKFIFSLTYKQKKCYLSKKLYAFFITIYKKNYSKNYLYEKNH